MEFIEADHQEWCAMWEAVAEHALNGGDPICLNEEDCWEYMGSTADHHHFRHLNHPGSGEKVFIYIERQKARFAWAS